MMLSEKPHFLSGMTLNEIMVTVVIISILGTLGIMTYVRVYEKNRGQQAVAILRLMRTAERVYYLDWNIYTDLTAPCTSFLITKGYLQCPNLGNAVDRGFDYTLTTGGGGNTYTATATRKGTGSNATKTITLGVTCSPCPETPTWGGTGPSEWKPPN